MPRPDRAAPSAPPRPEFSRPLRVSGLARGGEAVAGAATEPEREALARRYGVLAVPRLSFEARVIPSGDGWRVEGVARARILQRCVVTLNEVSSRLEEGFARTLLPGAPPPDLVDLDPEEEEDPPEPLGAVIDPAEMAAEAVALAIEPYPRAPGVAFAGRAAAAPGADPDAPDGAAPDAPRPFAALAALRERLAAPGAPGAPADDADPADDPADDPDPSDSER